MKTKQMKMLETYEFKLSYHQMSASEVSCLWKTAAMLLLAHNFQRTKVLHKQQQTAPKTLSTSRVMFMYRTLNTLLQHCLTPPDKTSRLYTGRLWRRLLQVDSWMAPTVGCIDLERTRKLIVCTIVFSQILMMWGKQLFQNRPVLDILLLKVLDV